MRISEWMEKWHKKYVEDEDGKTRVHHSTSYHNFFQGYSEKKVLGPEGKGYRIVRKYTAPYLAFTENRKTWIRYKLLYSVLYLASCALTLAALCSGARANRAGWVAVLGVLQLVAALLMLIPLGNYVFAPMYMKMGEFNISAKRLGFLSVPAAVLGGLYFVSGVVWYALTRNMPEGNDLSSLLFQLLSAVAAGFLCVTERRTKYKRIENETVSATGFDANEIW